MNDDFQPRPVVALFPFALGATEAVTARDADLCRGFACFIDRRFSQITGTEIVLQNLFITPENNPARRGWLMTNTLWSYEQISRLPHLSDGQFTHALQGQLTWRADRLDATLHLLDLFDGDVMMNDTASGDIATALPQFFTLLGRAVHLITGSQSAGRIAARRPTASAEAFENYLLALAAQHAFQHEMVAADAAFAHYAKALELDPEFRTAAGDLETLASECFARGSGADAAFAALEKITSASAHHPRLTALYALQLALTHRDNDRALALMQSYVQAEPQGTLASETLVGIGEIYRHRNDLSRARACMRAATIANPDNAAAWEKLGQYHNDVGDLALAENCWKRALQEDPTRATSLFLLARTHAARGDDATALLFLDQLLAQQDSPSSSARALQVATLLRLGRHDDANTAATDFAEQAPLNTEAWFTLFTARAAMDDLNAAAFCLDRIAQLPLQRDDQKHLQLCRLRLHSPADHAEYEALSTVHPPTDSEAQRAHDLAHRHQDVTALSELSAKLLLATRQHDRALNVLHLLLRNDPQNASYLRQVADAHEQNADLPRAIEALSQSLHSDNSDSAAHQKLQQLIRRQRTAAPTTTPRRAPTRTAPPSLVYRCLYAIRARIKALLRLP